MDSLDLLFVHLLSVLQTEQIKQQSSDRASYTINSKNKCKKNVAVKALHQSVATRLFTRNKDLFKVYSTLHKVSHNTIFIISEV